MTKVACASDIHGSIKLQYPAADILVLAGDILPNLSRNKAHDAQIQKVWCQDTLVPYLKRACKSYGDVVFIPGNHDRCFEYYEREMVELVNSTGAHCMLDSGKELQGLKFWGSPWTPWFYGDHWSFNLTYAYTREDADEVWGKIPSDTDVLVTHGPPYGILDTCPDLNSPEDVSVGCPYLLEHVTGRVKPKLHIFGHIHEGHGFVTRDNIGYVNAAVMNGKYKPKNKIRVVNI